MLVLANTVEMSRPLSGVSALSDGSIAFNSTTQVMLQFKLRLNGGVFTVGAPYPSLLVYTEDYQLLLSQVYVPGSSGWLDENTGVGYIAFVINGAATALNSLQLANHKLYWNLTGRFGGLIDIVAITGEMLFSRVNPLSAPPAVVGVTRDYANLNDAYAAAAIASFGVNDYVYISGDNPYEAQKGVWKVITSPGTEIGHYTRVLEVDLDTNYPVGPAGGDLAGTYPNPSVGLVGGVAANTVAAAGVAVAAATSLNVINTLVKRDGTGAIYAALHGTADSVPWTGVTGTPTTLNGYGIVDAAPKGLVTVSGLTSNTGTILGRTTAGTGAVEELSAGTGITIAGGSVSVTDSTYQPININLTGLSGLSGPGYAKWTGANTVTMVATVPWSDISGAPSFVTNVIWGSITGDISNQADLASLLLGKQPLDGTLSALSTLTGSGYAKWASTDSVGMVATIPWSDISGAPSFITGVGWGSITGVLSNQTDLGSALDGKQPLDTTLTAIAGVVSAPNTVLLSTGVDTFVAGQISNVYISGTAAISWAKINKVGAVPSDVGAAASGPVVDSGLTQSNSKLLGRTTSGTGAVEEISAGTGLVLSAGVLAVTGAAPTGGAGGDLAGTYPSPTVKQVHGVSATLGYDGNNRLSTYTSAYGTKTFTYDLNGVLQSINGTGIYANKTFSYTGPQLTGITVTG